MNASHVFLKVTQCIFDSLIQRAIFQCIQFDDILYQIILVAKEGMLLLHNQKLILM